MFISKRAFALLLMGEGGCLGALRLLTTSAMHLGFIQVPGRRFQVSGFRFQVSGFGFQVTGYRFQVSGFRFRIPGFRVRDSGPSAEIQVSGFTNRSRINFLGWLFSGTGSWFLGLVRFAVPNARL